MDLFDRIYAVHRILQHARYPVSRRKLETALSCSASTVKRIINAMRDHLAAPICYHPQANGYAYDPNQEYFELPGLWFNAAELHALIMVHQLLLSLQPGLLDAQLQPIKKRIETILKSKYTGSADMSKLVRVLGMSVRSCDQTIFRQVAHALCSRRCLQLTYHSRSQNTITDRMISPQRLVHYRDNWYVDGWDHCKQAIRSFALERINHVTVLRQKAKNLTEKRLDRHFTAVYGIFSGKPEHTAVLQFNRESARWVGEECWHPDQQGRWLATGDYLLRVPYSDHRELIMDILKYGSRVEVLEPASLRQAVKQALTEALKKYEKNKQQ